MCYFYYPIASVGIHIQWIQCDVCMSWYHWECVGLSAKDVKDTHTCLTCEQKKQTVNNDASKTATCVNIRSSTGNDDDSDEIMESPLAIPLSTPHSTPLATPLAATLSPVQDISTPGETLVTQEVEEHVVVDGDALYNLTTSHLDGSVVVASSVQADYEDSIPVEMIVSSEPRMTLSASTSHDTTAATTVVGVEVLECHEEMMPEIDEEEQPIVAMLAARQDELTRLV